MEAACRSHGDWDDAVGFVESYNRVDEDANPHVDSILSFGSNYGVERDDFEETFSTTRDTVAARAKTKITKFYYREGATADDIFEAVEKVGLDGFFPSWGGFAIPSEEELYRNPPSRDELLESVETAVDQYFSELLRDEFPIGSNKYIESFGGAKLK